MDPQLPSDQAPDLPSQPPPVEPASVPTTELCCPFCQARMSVPATLAGSTASCPTCRGVFQVPMPQALPSPSSPYAGSAVPQDLVNKKLAAGLCGIFFGGWGVHKFILGFNNAGIIMLLCSVAGIILGSCLIFPMFLTLAMHIIGIIEGIIYLSKSDQDFYQLYGVRRQEWF